MPSPPVDFENTVVTGDLPESFKSGVVGLRGRSQLLPTSLLSSPGMGDGELNSGQRAWEAEGERALL